ncbi:hypothetical protein GCM10010170_056630 [Dactylosporangium salmoneum]|uniref:Uncharacterized protein n=1 Tax=Dactylosporangium salmoneum TaxID=53361 RepID=A0ABN3GUH5_9ACTN
MTLVAVAILFALYAFIAAGANLSRALVGRGGGHAVYRTGLAVLDAAAGVVALAWPGITVLTLVV